MTLVVHWGDGVKSIIDGFPWEIQEEKVLVLFHIMYHSKGTIPIKSVLESVDNSTVYHVWTDATEWEVE